MKGRGLIGLSDDCVEDPIKIGQAVVLNFDPAAGAGLGRVNPDLGG